MGHERGDGEKLCPAHRLLKIQGKIKVKKNDEIVVLFLLFFVLAGVQHTNKLCGKFFSAAGGKF